MFSRILFRKYILLWIIHLALSLSTSVCQIKNIKGTYDILDDTHKHFSLVHGAVAWETGYIRKLYDCGHIFPRFNRHNQQGQSVISGYDHTDEQHNIIRFVHALFYRVPGSTAPTDFGVTQQLATNDPILIAEYAAEIVVVLEKIQARRGAFLNYINTQEQNLQKQIAENSTLLTSLDETLAQTDKTKHGAIIGKASGEEKAALQKRSKARQSVTLLNTAKTNPYLLPKDLASHENCGEFLKLLKILDQSFAKILQPCVLELISPSLGTVVYRALDECDDDVMFPKHMITTIILSFVYVTCSHKCPAITVFYEKLNELSGQIISKPLSDCCFSNITSQDAIKRMQKCDMMSLLKNNPDEFVYCAFMIRSFPAPVTFATAECTKQGHTVKCSDCMENSIRNFINLLAYDLEKNIFSVEALKNRTKPKDGVFHSSLEEFMKAFTDVSKASSLDAHNKWLELMTHIPYVSYIEHSGGALAQKRGFIAPYHTSFHALGYQQTPVDQVGFNLRPSLTNFIIALNHLLNLELFSQEELVQALVSKKFVQQYLPALCKRLEITLEKTSIETNKLDEKDFGDVIVTILQLNGFLRCELKTQAGHGEFCLEGGNKHPLADMLDLNINTDSEHHAIVQYLRKDPTLSILYFMLSPSEANVHNIFLQKSNAPLPLLFNLFGLPIENHDFVNSIVGNFHIYLTKSHESVPDMQVLNEKTARLVFDFLFKQAKKNPDDNVKKWYLSRLFDVFATSPAVNEPLKQHMIGKIVEEQHFETLDYTAQQKTYLMMSRNVELAQALIAAAGDKAYDYLTIRNSNDESALDLHISNRSKAHELVAFLLKTAGNKAFEYISIKNSLQETAIHYAAKYGNKEALKMLLHVAGDNAFTYISSQKYGGGTALHIAADMGYEDIINVLIDAAGDNLHKLFSIKECSGDSPFHCTMYGVHSESKIKVLQLLLKAAGSRASDYILAKNAWGCNLLQIAAWQKREDTIFPILKPYINTRDLRLIWPDGLQNDFELVSALRMYCIRTVLRDRRFLAAAAVGLGVCLKYYFSGEIF